MAIKSGMAITRVFDSLVQTATTKRLRTISRGIKDMVDSGSSLTDAFRKYDGDFPEMFISSITVGEETGHIDYVSQQLANHYSNQYRVMSKMKSELLFIVVYGFVLLSLVVFIRYIFSDWDIRVVYDSMLYIAFFGVLCVLLPWTLYKKLRPFRIIVQSLLHSIPILGWILKKFCLSRFSSSMALGLKVGMEIRGIIRFSAKAMGNPSLEAKVLRAISYIDSGDTISESLVKTRVFPVLVNHMYETGEESGKLFEMMEKIADVTGEQAENSLKIFIRIFTLTVYLVVLLIFAALIIQLAAALFGKIGLI